MSGVVRPADGGLRKRLRRSLPSDRDAARTSVRTAATAAVISFAAFAGIVAILWLVAANGGGKLGRDVVMALSPSTEAPSDAAPRPSAGIEGGLVVPPLTAAVFSHLPRFPPDTPLPPAPDPALIETTSAGRLPIISADGRLPRNVYARPHDHQGERARLVMIVSGIGLSRSASAAAIERLPGAVVLAIDAYAARPDHWAAAARRSGHEILATIPLEQADVRFHDEGPRALRAVASAEENVRRLDAVLGSLTGYVGALAVGGAAFDEDAVSLGPVLDGLRARGLLLVDDTAQRDAPVFRVSGELGPPLIQVDVRIDESADVASIDRQLGYLQTIAREQSVGVALARPYPKTLERLRAWISAFDDRRFVLAPVSAVVDQDGLR